MRAARWLQGEVGAGAVEVACVRAGVGRDQEATLGAARSKAAHNAADQDRERNQGQRSPHKEERKKKGREKKEKKGGE